MTAEFEVPALLRGVRIDRAVSMLTGVTRSVAAGLVAEGKVRVDGAVATTRSLPLEGAVLSVEVPPAADRTPPADRAVAFAVVFEDEQVVVVDKPAGLVVHPGAGRTSGTLVSGLLARYPDLGRPSVVWDPGRPGIVHRLDRGTSGLLAVARTDAAYRSLVAQLGARTVSRRYLALVAGHVAEDRGAVEAPIGRSTRTPTRMAVSAQGREARTTYRVLARHDHPLPSTLLALTLDTGRTHQIRVHLAAIGHPVVGDDRYGGPGRVGGSLLAPGRLFLHAAELGFDHPVTAERLSFSSPLPDDLAGLVADGLGGDGQAAR
ncbi:MAG: RluA family pseudouridine synthase [Acidimicrobiales bacterium]